MNVQSLWIYPVKSLAGIEVPRFELDEFGPKADRRWMIVDAAGQFVTQRKVPQLARIAVMITSGQVQVAIPGEGSFKLRPSDDRLPVQVWGDQVQALTAETPASQALSRYCGQQLRFVYMPDDSFRRIDPECVPDVRRVGFADGFPVLIANLASLEELNGRLESPVDIRRFRPNVVVDDVEPWSEDHWRELSVGGLRFSLVKPCSRCIMTTVDPDSGEQSGVKEPLKTLSSYRRGPDGVIFGMNAIHHSPGCIEVGDPVTINHTE